MNKMKPGVQRKIHDIEVYLMYSNNNANFGPNLLRHQFIYLPLADTKVSLFQGIAQDIKSWCIFTGFLLNIDLLVFGGSVIWKIFIM